MTLLPAVNTILGTVHVNLVSDVSRLWSELSLPPPRPPYNCLHLRSTARGHGDYSKASIIRQGDTTGWLPVSHLPCIGTRRRRRRKRRRRKRRRRRKVNEKEEDDEDDDEEEKPLLKGTPSK